MPPSLARLALAKSLALRFLVQALCNPLTHPSLLVSSGTCWFCKPPSELVMLPPRAPRRNMLSRVASYSWLSNRGVVHDSASPPPPPRSSSGHGTVLVNLHRSRCDAETSRHPIRLFRAVPTGESGEAEPG
ncbi:hypothetical protein EDB81DRAFT_809700 [Dactylonectria macrodidyma]|uniref:Secreted protein n=1 Tax=Dactylonectria macrodidyma TaxID=307937 RepID=A0A9P9DWN6_9HYPO|nr:hypothetical protein EDB81DRAFT_809700 [Dactylonectria macrodidyma]